MQFVDCLVLRAVVQSPDAHRNGNAAPCMSVDDSTGEPSGRALPLHGGAQSHLLATRLELWPRRVIPAVTG
jgi:hypothetical protein